MDATDSEAHKEWRSRRQIGSNTISMDRNQWTTRIAGKQQQTLKSHHTYYLVLAPPTTQFFAFTEFRFTKVYANTFRL